MKKNKDNENHLFGVILAGGSGTRLWPLSRELYPKQLLNLIGDKTLIQQTFLRLSKIIPLENIYIITNKNLTEDIYFQLKELGAIKKNIITEPFSKNTAPAIALAAGIIFKKNKEAKILVASADHFIESDSEFIKASREAFKIAEDNFLITFGVVPDYPSQEYGYINPKIENKNKKNLNYQRVEKFVEKPNLELAEKLIKRGSYWNSGIFVWRAKTILDGIKKFLPKVYKATNVYFQDYDKFSKLFHFLEPISIDKGVLEKSDNVVVLPAKFDWRDIGSWKALHEILPKDRNKNVLNSYVISEDCSNCLIQGVKKRIAVAIGLENLIIVDTEDAVLVVDKNYSHKIKNSVEKIKQNNLNQHIQHLTIYRPWGYYTILEKGENFKVKKIIVEPKQKLSLQSHQKRSEHWTILKGSAKVELNGKIFNLKSHQSIDIPIGLKHRLENLGIKNLELIEIQSGDYLEEDDIVRFSDEYEREIKK